MSAKAMKTQIAAPQQISAEIYGDYTITTSKVFLTFMGYNQVKNQTGYDASGMTCEAISADCAIYGEFGCRVSGRFETRFGEKQHVLFLCKSTDELTYKMGEVYELFVATCDELVVRGNNVSFKLKGIERNPKKALKSLAKQAEKQLGIFLDLGESGVYETQF